MRPVRALNLSSVSVMGYMTTCGMSNLCVPHISLAHKSANSNTVAGIRVNLDAPQACRHALPDAAPADCLTGPQGAGLQRGKGQGVGTTSSRVDFHLPPMTQPILVTDL